MFTLDKSMIENRIFKMKIEIDTDYSSKRSVGKYSSQKSDQVMHRYLQIKRQQYESTITGHELIQIIDVSAQIMYNKASGEKQFLTMINAFVSHEIRNPLNFIKMQIIRQKFLNEKIYDIIQNNEKYSRKRLKKKIEKIKIEQDESNDNLSNGEKILNFFVQDILDLSQL